jgi:hypothetical protein
MAVHVTKLEMSRRDFLRVAGAATLACAAGGVGVSAARAAPTSTRLLPDFTLLLRGIDEIDGVLYASDVDNDAIRQSADWAATWSAPKTLPPNTVATQVTRFVRHKDTLYCAGRDGVLARLAVWSSPLVDGDAPFEWTATPLPSQPSTSAKSGTQLANDDTYLYAGEYGEPANGPNLYRSLDASSWETVFSGADQVALIGRTARHIHAVAADPFNSGHVYVTTGDFGVQTGAALWRSTASGDPGTWEVVLATGLYQSSQISFAADTIWLAGDNHVDTAVVIDRATMTAAPASPTHHYEIPVPGGAPGDAYYRIASHGAVDAGSGIYYCVTTTDIGNTEGMFAIQSVGSPVVLVDPGGQGIGMRSQVFIANGNVWSGQWYRPLLDSTA